MAENLRLELFFDRSFIKKLNKQKSVILMSVVYCIFGLLVSVQKIEMTSSKQKENKKTRSRKETKETKALSKVIVRRLPAKLKESDFLEAVDPLPKNDYFRYVLADESTGMHSFST